MTQLAKILGICCYYKNKDSVALEQSTDVDVGNSELKVEFKSPYSYNRLGLCWANERIPIIPLI